MLVKADNLCFTTNLKTLETVEYFLLEIILKNMFESKMFGMFWSYFYWGPNGNGLIIVGL